MDRIDSGVVNSPEIRGSQNRQRNVGKSGGIKRFREDRNVYNPILILDGNFVNHPRRNSHTPWH